MNTAEFIDAMSRHVLNKGEASVGDADTRARILFHAQTALKRRWNRRPWWWRGAQEEVTVRADGECPMPTNFSSFGKDGFLMNPAAKGSPLIWLPPNKLLKMRELSTGTSRTPRYYTLFGQMPSDEDFDANAWIAQVHRAPGVSIGLIAYYDRVAPTLADTDDSDPDEPSGLLRVPVDFVETVLMSDVRAALMFDEGDTRSLEYEQKADRADSEMWAEHVQGRHVPRGSPRYGAGVIR